MSITDEDRKTAVSLLRSIAVGAESTTVELVAAALAEEREKARAPFLALAEEVWRDGYGKANSIEVQAAHSRISYLISRIAGES